MVDANAVLMRVRLCSVLRLLSLSLLLALPLLRLPLLLLLFALSSSLLLAASLSYLQASVNNCFIRGSVVRYIHLPKEAVDLEVLHDATRRNHRGEAAK